jgi:hypothetical protein
MIRLFGLATCMLLTGHFDRDKLYVFQYAIRQLSLRCICYMKAPNNSAVFKYKSVPVVRNCSLPYRCLSPVYVEQIRWSR